MFSVAKSSLIVKLFTLAAAVIVSLGAARANAQTFTGTVRTAAGVPVANATITLYKQTVQTEPVGRISTPPQVIVATTRTDAYGNFVINGNASATYRINARSPSGATGNRTITAVRGHTYAVTVNL